MSPEDEILKWKGLLGDLVDALHDELAYEVSQSPDVLDQTQRACVALGDAYQGYIGGWL